MADVILYLAAVLVVIVVLLAIPAMRRADQETRVAIHREQARHHHGHAHVGSIDDSDLTSTGAHRHA